MKKYAWVILLAVITILIMVLSLTNIINQSIGMRVALVFMIIFNICVLVYSRKNDIKIITWLMVLLTIMGVILLGYNILGYNRSKLDRDYKFQILANKSDSEKALLFSHGGHDYYTYNMSDIEVLIKEEDKKYSLEKALKEGKIKLDEILNLMVPNSNTLGYKIYYDGGQENIDNDEYSLVICENKNKDVVFAPFNYTYKEDICK